MIDYAASFGFLIRFRQIFPKAGRRCARCSRRTFPRGTCRVFFRSPRPQCRILTRELPDGRSNMTTATSVTLLERLRRPGEQDAWRRFVGLYTPLIYFWGRQAGLQQHDAADLVQAVFAHLVEKMPGFVYDPARRFRAWLRTVTLNLLGNRGRRRGDRPIAYGEQGLDAVAVPDGVESLVEEDYQGYLVKRALRVIARRLHRGDLAGLLAAHGRGPARRRRGP